MMWVSDWSLCTKYQAQDNSAPVELTQVDSFGSYIPISQYFLKSNQQSLDDQILLLLPQYIL